LGSNLIQQRIVPCISAWAQLGTYCFGDSLSTRRTNLVFKKVFTAATNVRPVFSPFLGGAGFGQYAPVSYPPDVDHLDVGGWAYATRMSSNQESTLKKMIRHRCFCRQFCHGRGSVGMVTWTMRRDHCCNGMET
jgi:hypothetical protein